MRPLHRQLLRGALQVDAPEALPTLLSLQRLVLLDRRQLHSSYPLLWEELLKVGHELFLGPGYLDGHIFIRLLLFVIPHPSIQVG